MDDVVKLIKPLSCDNTDYYWRIQGTVFKLNLREAESNRHPRNDISELQHIGKGRVATIRIRLRAIIF